MCYAYKYAFEIMFKRLVECRLDDFEVILKLG